MSFLLRESGGLPALENLDIGMQLHSLNVKCGVEMDQFVVTGIINLDAKCGELDLVHRAFWEVKDLQLSAWTTLIGGCVKGREAIDLSSQGFPFAQFHQKLEAQVAQPQDFEVTAFLRGSRKSLFDDFENGITSGRFKRHEVLDAYLNLLKITPIVL
ncbi:hypothetical protein Vadar_002108 [Vaccinium darrowii]|nr:hypothetical protein Vadar_002108 [Vaccinium darrowii]